MTKEKPSNLLPISYLDNKEYASKRLQSSIYRKFVKSNIFKILHVLKKHPGTVIIIIVYDQMYFYSIYQILHVCTSQKSAGILKFPECFETFKIICVTSNKVAKILF